MACKGCGKKNTTTSYYDNKYKGVKDVDSPGFTPTPPKKKSTRKGMDCEITYENLLNCLTAINKSTLEMAERALIRAAIAEMINDINKVCPNVDKFNTLREKVYGAIPV